MIERNKESHVQSLVELQQEIKSLKTLLLSRGGPASPGGLSTPVVPAKPSIPAWQLTGANHLGSSSLPASPPTLPGTSLYPIQNSSPASSKGKEVETAQVNDSEQA